MRKNKQKFVVKFYTFRPPFLWGMPTAGASPDSTKRYAAAYHTEYKTTFFELFLRLLMVCSSKLLSR